MLVLLCGVLGVLAIVIYRLTHPPAVPESTNPSHYWMTSTDAAWQGRGGKVIPGWWIQGRKDAPAIVLVPGYGMSRSDVLSLASVLNQQGYYLLVYDQRASGEYPRGTSCLGLCETDDLVGALDFIKRQPDVDTSRLGIYGVDRGGRSARRAAAVHPEVKALVVDSVFDAVGDFLDYRIHETLGLNNRLLNFACRGMFQFFRLGFPVSRFERLALYALSNRSVLLIEGENREALARCTTDMYERIRPQKQMVRLPLARVRNMSGEELASYDQRVVEFFRLNLP